MRKTISRILLGIAAAGLLAGCVGVSESNPSEKKTTQMAAKPGKNALQERLYEAIKENDLESVKKLVAQGADITYADFFGQNALHYAASSHSLEIFQWLLDQGSDIHATDKDDNNMLHLLFNSSGVGSYGINIDTGEFYCCPGPKSKPETTLKIIKYLTDRKVNLNAKNQHGMTPVRLAVCFGYLEIVKYLMEHGADIKGTLHLAAKTGQYDMVKYLVEQYGEDVNQFDGEALMYASGTDVVRYLVEHGAKINIQDEWGRTPLHWHAERKNLETIKYMVSSGADIHRRAKDGSSVIHWAANHGRIQNVDFFLKLGLDINDRDNDGKTPLHYACDIPRHDLCKIKKEIIRYLVEHGSDINLRDKGGRTPLDYAQYSKEDEIAKYLKAHGAVSGKSLNGKEKQ